MRDDHRAPMVPGEELFEPAHRVDVQVIRRFIQQEKLPFGQQQLGQGGPAFLPPGQGSDGKLPVIVDESQPAQHLAEALLAGVSAGRQKPGVHLVVFGHQVAGFGRVVVARHRLGQFMQTPLQGSQVFECGCRLVVQGLVRAQVGILGEVADAQSAGGRDGAHIGFDQSGDHPE